MVGPERSVSMPVGVVVERREIDNRWQRWSHRPVAVIPGAPATAEWRELERGQGFQRWHAATLSLELHRKDTEAYRVNLSGQRPVVYVVMRPDLSAAADGPPLSPFRVTASAYEAQDHMDGDDLVEGVTMPAGVVAWVQAFIDRHHVEQPFIKRRRDGQDPEAFGGRRGAAGDRRGRA